MAKEAYEQIYSVIFTRTFRAKTALIHVLKTIAQNKSFQTFVYLQTICLPSVIFVCPVDKRLFSRPSARSLEEFQRIHSLRWGCLITFRDSDARITPCDLQQATYGSTVQRKVRTSESPGKEVKGFVDLIRHLPDETKGPFIDKLVKNDQDRTRQLVHKVRLAQIFGDVYLQLVSGVNVTYGIEGTSKSQNEAE